MRRRQVGTVGALWRYPVKSLRGEALREAAITERGVLGDRVWALIEAKYGGSMSARTWPTMLELRASYHVAAPGADGAEVRIELPGRGEIRIDDPATASLLSEIFGREVRIERIRSEPLTRDEFEAIIRSGAVPPRRDFFDEDTLHVLATGTLAHLRRLCQTPADFDPRRFRANILVDTGKDDDGFIEDGWLDGVLEIGESVRIVGMRPALRCATTTHPQDELEHDPNILRTAWQHHQAYVGVFASAGATGTVRIGDPVTLAV